MGKGKPGPVKPGGNKKGGGGQKVGQSAVVHNKKALNIGLDIEQQVKDLIKV